MNKLPETAELDSIPILYDDAKKVIRNFELQEKLDKDLQDLNEYNEEKVELETNLNHHKNTLKFIKELYMGSRNIRELELSTIIRYLIYCFGKSKNPLDSIENMQKKDLYLNKILDIDSLYGNFKIGELLSKKDQSLRDLLEILELRKNKVHSLYEKVPGEKMLDNPLLGNIREDSPLTSIKASVENTVKLLPIKEKILELEGKLLEKLIKAISSYNP